MHNVIHYIWNQQIGGQPEGSGDQVVLRSRHGRISSTEYAQRQDGVPAREQIWGVAQRKLDQLNAVVSLDSLRIRRESVGTPERRPKRGNQHTNQQLSSGYVSFGTDDGPERVEITDYH